MIEEKKTRIIASKFELMIDEENKEIIDTVSDNLRLAYNSLLQECIEDYQIKKDTEKGIQREEEFQNLLSSKYDLRNYFIKCKKDTEYRNYYASIVKNTALRLYDAYNRFFKGQNGHPKFKAFNVKYFSLFYDEPSKIPKIEKNGDVLIKIGKDKSGKNLNFKAKLKGYFEKGTIKTATIKKNLATGKYYLSLSIEVELKPIIESDKSKKFISIDPNHKNFFCSIDSDGVSMEVSRLDIAQRLDDKIDEVKSLMSHKKKYSRKHKKLQKVLNKLYHKRDEQIKNALYGLAHYLAKRYNVIIIGDYTPSKDVARYKNQRRSMLNQTFIGLFRTILKHVCCKYGKVCLVADESYTTQECCIKHTLTKREPSVREWIVDGRKVLRDINSAVNIARKEGYGMGEKFTDMANLSSIDVEVEMRYNKKLSSCLARTALDGRKLSSSGVLFNDSDSHYRFYMNKW